MKQVVNAADIADIKYKKNGCVAVWVLRMREPRAVASFWLCIRRLFCPEFFVGGTTVAVGGKRKSLPADWCYFLRDSTVYF